MAKPLPGQAPDLPVQGDLSNCDREPIHVPGAIQPHGALLALDPAGTIRVTSTNVQTSLGINPRALLGTSVADLLSPDSAYELARRIAQLDGDLRMCLPLQAAGRRFDAALHRSGPFTVLELEPAAPRARDELDHEEFLRALTRFQQAPSLTALFQCAAGVFREFVGYDRVMLYRFDDDRNGEVVGEARRDDLEAYLGLHYPATDIPQQAHALYLRSRLRMIADIEYQPVPLVPRVDVTSDRPLDLGISWLRSVSPVHVEYLRNMGVRATLVLSLVHGGRLWGLVSCHHYAPRVLPQRERQRCEVLAQALANQIAAVEQSERLRALEAMQAAQRRLLHAAATCPPDQLRATLARQGEGLRAAVRADGAVLWLGEAVIRSGHVPSNAALHGLVAWLDRKALREVYATHHLAAELPWAEQIRETTAGLLALPLSDRGGQYALWFRPELVETVTWGGEPGKAAAEDADGVRLSPRKSFERWKQVVRLRAEPWGPLELEAAAALQRLADILMRKRLELEIQQSHALEAIGRLAGSVAHDFNNLLQGISGAVDILESMLPDDDLARRYLAEISEAARGGADLTHKLLQFAGEREPDRETAELNTCVVAASDALRRTLGPAIALDVRAGALRGRVGCSSRQLEQILLDLADNARRAMPEGGTLTITTEEVRRDSGRLARLVVSDTGVGMSEHTRARALDPFFTTHPLAAGTGLSSVRGVVAQAGGSISLESEPGAGTRVTIHLPIHAQASGGRPAPAASAAAR